MMTNRPLYLIIGESGSGKDTIVDRVCEMMRVNKVRSHTTRPQRPGEPDTAHCFFGPYDFTVRRDLGQFAAVTTFDGYLYGATWHDVETGDLYIIDPEGAASLDRERLGRPVYEVFVDALPDFRRIRMLKRGQTPEEVTRRMEHDREAFAAYREDESWDYILNNSRADAGPVVATLARIIASHWPKEETQCDR